MIISIGIMPKFTLQIADLRIRKILKSPKKGRSRGKKIALASEK
jgi:hypothetical protein